MADIVFKNIIKKFGKVVAVNEVNVTAQDKEFMVFLGPSGCGKTTCLRMIAGLEEPTSGDIFIGDQRINGIDPRDRDIAMVFQNYALYPHMDVYRNMSFGLRLRKVSKDEVERRVQNAARILGITELLDRKPKELSGGQRQRVAMGRAIVREPQAFLFDEPLSNLDAKLRVGMRAELAKLHEQLQKTIVYVTHDQIEAMTLADRIVVMEKGRIRQVGKPMTIYNEPENLFVAGFIGSPSMNFFNVRMSEENGNLYLNGEHIKLRVPGSLKERYQSRKSGNRETVLGIRPEHIYDSGLKRTEPGEEPLKMDIEVVEPIGSGVILLGSLGPNKITACVNPKSEIQPHTQAQLLMDMNEMHLFDRETGQAL